MLHINAVFDCHILGLHAAQANPTRISGSRRQVRSFEPYVTRRWMIPNNNYQGLDNSNSYYNHNGGNYYTRRTRAIQTGAIQQQQQHQNQSTAIQTGTIQQQQQQPESVDRNRHNYHYYYYYPYYYPYNYKVYYYRNYQSYCCYCILWWCC